MDNQIENRETLKAIALGLVNDVYKAFGKPHIARFKPAITNEDTDCVLEALEQASGMELSWGCSEGEKSWLTVCGEYRKDPIHTYKPLWSDRCADACQVLEQVWGTSQRIDGGLHEVEVPAILIEFAGRVALEGEYPELVKE